MNIIYIQPKGVPVIKSPILDDFQVEAVSEFGSISELVPTLDTVVSLVTAVESAGSNRTSRTAVLARSVLDGQRWLKTNPVKLTLDLHFYTETDAKKDVIDKMNILLGLHILRFDSKSGLVIPGINSKNVAEIAKTLTDKKNEKKTVTPSIPILDTGSAQETLKNTPNNTISVLIPGVIYLPLAFIYAIQPTYSKFRTDGGYPLWATANVQIYSFGPAILDNFEDGMNMREWAGKFVNINTNKITTLGEIQ
jgi:hypothetical protein